MQSHNLIRALLIAACIVIHPAHAVNQGEDMKQAMQTICLGRFLVDVPKKANYIGGMVKYSWYSLDIENIQGADSFEKLVATRIQELQQTKHNKEPSLFHRLIEIDPHTKIIQYRGAPPLDESFDIQGFTYRGLRVFTFKGTAQDDRVNASIERMRGVLASLRPRRPNEFPTEPGFCIDGAYLAGEPGQPHDESATARFGLKGHPDVWIYMYTDMNGDKEHMDGGLLARVNDGKPFPAELLEVAKQIRSLREGKHPVKGFAGEEILDAFPTDGGGYSHKFRWESSGKPRSIKEPTIVVELETATADGGGLLNNSSLTDKQAIELFDAIVNSIRLRPTGPAKTSAADPTPNDDNGAAKRLPLGTQVSSLHSCPESGVYECASDAPGVTSRRVFLEQGRPMPGAFTTAPKRGIAGYFGGQESKEIETVWTLTAYEPGA